MLLMKELRHFIAIFALHFISSPPKPSIHRSGRGKEQGAEIE